jgi:hypothetical protein
MFVGIAAGGKWGLGPVIVGLVEFNKTNKMKKCRKIENVILEM